MELATYCELFAQLKETTTDSCNSTREFVDGVCLLVNRLNGIAPDSIGDKAHIAILLTQVGPEYAFIVDAIQNGRETIHATAVGTRLANAERAVRGKETASRSTVTTKGSINAVKTPVKKCNYCKKRGHEVQKCWKKNPHLKPARKDDFANADRSDSGSPHRNSSSLSQQEDRQGPAASKRQKVHVVRTRATALYTRAPNPLWILDSAATSHICWDRDCFIDLRPHREMLETAGDPVETEGIGTVKLSLRGKPSSYPCPQEGILRTPDRNESGQRAQTLERPLLGGGTPEWHPRPAWKSHDRECVPHRGRSAGSSLYSERTAFGPRQSGEVPNARCGHLGISGRQLGR